MKGVDLILTADWHIRDDTPECRTDDFMAAQAAKFDFLWQMQENYQCPVLVAGDVFNHWKPSPQLLSWAFLHIPKETYAIPGNHDLSAHSLENINKSGINTLAAGDAISLFSKGHGLRKSVEDIRIYGFPFGSYLTNIKRSTKFRNVALIHTLVYQGKEPFPGASEVGNTAKRLCKELDGFDLIVTGDNHQTIVEKIGDTLLINAGSLMRTTASQIDHKPCIFLWNAEYNTADRVYLSINEGAVSREHLELEKEKEERTSVFIEKLNSNIELSNSFKDNMKNYLNKNKVKKPVTSIIWEAIDG